MSEGGGGGLGKAWCVDGRADARGDWHCSLLSALPEGLKVCLALSYLNKVGLNSNVMDCVSPVTDSRAHTVCFGGHVEASAHLFLTSHARLHVILKRPCLTGRSDRPMALSGSGSLWSDLYVLTYLVSLEAVHTETDNDGERGCVIAVPNTC